MSAVARIRHEVREIGLVTAYFLTCFLCFLSLKKLLLAQYDIETTVLGTAIIAALVVAKVVVILGKTTLGDRFRSTRRIVHVLYRSLVYVVFVLLVTFAERLFDSYREVGGLSAALSRLWAGKDLDHFLALNLCVGLSLLVYNVFAEIAHYMGEGGLRQFFLGSQVEPRARPEA